MLETVSILQPSDGFVGLSKELQEQGYAALCFLFIEIYMDGSRTPNISLNKISKKVFYSLVSKSSTERNKQDRRTSSSPLQFFSVLETATGQMQLRK